MEGDGDYRAEEYYEGDGGLGCVYLPDVDGAPEGRPGGDRQPPVRKRGPPSSRGRSPGPTTERARLAALEGERRGDGRGGRRGDGVYS